MTHPDLRATTAAIHNTSFDRWSRTPYSNRFDVWGWHFEFWHALQYHSISIHNWPGRPTKGLIAFAIDGIEVISKDKCGYYQNGKGIPGFYATARSTRAIDGSLDHWYMIGRSAERGVHSLLSRKLKLEQEEIDLLDYVGGGSPQGWPIPGLRAISYPMQSRS